MLFKSSVYLFLYSSILLLINQSIISLSDPSETPNYQPRCILQTKPLDQVINYDNNYTTNARKKRFVLFPEFELFLDDFRYLHAPKELRYWIANFYPNKINTSYVEKSMELVVEQINEVIDEKIIIKNATDPGDANFHIHFFDYTKCPMDDPTEATVDNVQALEKLQIYPVELTRKSRYRAHGGITPFEGDRKISTIKFNTQQNFLYSDDFVYDPVIYTCNDTENLCDIDLYYVFLHEALHGFGIEHTTNARQPIPPNPKMQSVMYFSPIRMLCHDDIRAIRMVYNLTVKRPNVQFDDTCRRDFPMNYLQKLMYLLGRYLIYGSILSSIISTVLFVLTLIYLLIRYLYGLRSATDKPIGKNKRSAKRHGYLWHDGMI